MIVTDRIKIAKMLGWTEIRSRGFGGHHFPLGIPPKCGPEVFDFVPDFFNDAAADYLVLVHVRETWDSDRVCDLRENLKLMWERRASQQGGGAVWGCTQYQPGDNSRAALQASPEPPEDE